LRQNVLRCEWSDFGGNGLAPNSGYISDSAEGRPASSAVQSKKASRRASLEIGDYYVTDSRGLSADAPSFGNPAVSASGGDLSEERSDVARRQASEGRGTRAEACYRTPTEKRPQLRFNSGLVMYRSDFLFV